MLQCLKRKVFDQCVLPVMTYEAKTLTLTTASANKLMVTQRKMERSMLGVSLRDHIFLICYDKKSKERPPTRWTDDLRKFAGNWIQRAQDRKEWAEMGKAYVQQWTRRAK